MDHPILQVDTIPQQFMPVQNLQRTDAYPDVQQTLVSPLEAPDSAFTNFLENFNDRLLA